MKIINNNPQNLVRDTYASSVKLDLTLRANGEEKVSIITSNGNINPAGLAAPTVAPVITTSGAGTFTANKYWEYRYVYVAKVAYPLVENAITGGGSPAPRSNASPSGTANSVANTNAKIVSCTPSTDAWISHIWIYRTALQDSAILATDNSNAGNMNWIGEILNNPNIATNTFTDTYAVVGGELLESDNYPAPVFRYTVFADPYFYGWGNDIREVPLFLNSLGQLFLTGMNPRWYNGRDGQIIRFIGINTGGFDNQGSFRLKVITNTTGQLYLDIGLTQITGAGFSGNTTAYIKGLSTTLFRSKARNPLSWGFTDIQNSLRIPSIYAFTLGGGIGTAISVVAELSLLKLDANSPPKSYTLNLRNAGTVNFESSLKIISENNCITSHFSQYFATNARGQTVVRGADDKNFNLVECDGATQQPISAFVFNTLRKLDASEVNDRQAHGVFNPRHEINCHFLPVISLSSSGVIGSNYMQCLYQHGPTGYWGTIDSYDQSIAVNILDSELQELKTIIGTATGLIGEWMAPGYFRNWFEPQASTSGTQSGKGTVSTNNIADHFLPNGTFIDGSAVALKGVINNYISIEHKETATGIVTYYVCRISQIINAGTEFVFDRVFKYSNVYGFITSIYTQNIAGTYTAKYSIGQISMELGRSFTLGKPMTHKKLEELYTSWRNVDPNYVPEYMLFQSYVPEYATEFKMLRAMPSASPESFATTARDYYGIVTEWPINEQRTLGLYFRNTGESNAQLMNYYLGITADQT